MATWLNLALGIVQIIAWLIRRSEQAKWMNEGARQLAAKQIKEISNVLAQAASVEKELDALTAEQLNQRIEAEGWFRD